MAKSSPAGRISYQSNGMFLYPMFGFAMRASVATVSEGLGNHRPEPCSEQAVLPATIVPDGMASRSIHSRPPCSSRLACSIPITASSIGFNAWAGNNLPSSIRLAIFPRFLTKRSRASRASSSRTSGDSSITSSCACTAARLLSNTGPVLRIPENVWAIACNSVAAASNLNPRGEAGNDGISVVPLPQPGCANPASIAAESMFSG